MRKSLQKQSRSDIKTARNRNTVRHVQRNIVQTPDGVVNTVEKEIVHEQQHEVEHHVRQEFAEAKQAYVTERTKQLTDEILLMLDAPKQFGFSKKVSERLASLQMTEMPETRAGCDLALVLKNTKREIAVSCAKLPVNTALFFDAAEQKQFRQLKIQHFRTFGDPFPADALGNADMAMCLGRLKRKRRLQSRASHVDSGKQRHRPPTAQRSFRVGAGVTQRCTPVFPFSEEDLRVDEELTAIGSTVEHKDFVFLALQTNGEHPLLLRRVMCRCLTQGILADPQSYFVAWPRLVHIHRVEKRRVDSLALESCFFWGSQPAELVFACCEFELNRVTYKQCWMELSVLLLSPRYRDLAASAFVGLSVEAETSLMRELDEPRALIRVADEHQLGSLTHGLNRAIQRSEERFLPK